MHFEEPQKPKKTPIRILEAADKLFSQIGFDGVSVNDVAVEARVNKASVFYHFGNKEALFEQVLSNYHNAHQNALEQAFSDGGTKRERLHKVIDAYINFISENRTVPYFGSRTANCKQRSLRVREARPCSITNLD